VFSDLTTLFNAPHNRLSALKTDREAKGLETTDAVSGNANRAGIYFPQDVLERIAHKALPTVKTYAPDPLGQRVAREAVQRYYAQAGLTLNPHHLLLTPGTSVSYWYLFKILGNAGDEFLIPHPGYPLLEPIAAMAGVRLTPYALRYTDRWTYDLDSVESAITSKTKAIIIVSPHNPTGCIADDATLSALADMAKKHGLALISDEVFSPFIYDTDRLPRIASLKNAPLTFTLNGLSKMLALPGMKVGWIAVTGESSQVDKAMRALEMLSDTFLPVNELAQRMVPELLAQSAAFLRAFCLTATTLREQAFNAFSGVQGITAMRPEGGFYMPLFVKGQDADALCFELLETKGIYTHPGYYYDLEQESLVVSFLSEDNAIQKTAEALKSR
jgi:alanine-synthesizing transaminase